MLAVAAGSFASHVVTRSEFVQRRPAAMTAEEGAAFPIAFVTAGFCLGHLAKMQPGDRVLIHAAAGGVGMAAVRFAQRVGAEVFATAGSAWKRELLASMGIRHVMDSRGTDFAAEIMLATRGQGVDIVLNSLSGDAIEASFKVLARGGRFVEIGKRDIKTPEWVAARRRDYRYFIVDWGETAERHPKLIGGMLAALVDEVRRGTLTTLPRHEFALDDIERAFRFMAQARHAGKIVVRHGPVRPVAIRADGTYIVTGGLSGLGPVIARWLAERGAGRLVLVSRRGVTPETAPLLDALRSQGTEVIAEALDVTDEAALRTLVGRIRSQGPPLRGVIHSAGALDDAALLQQDMSRFARVLAPKVRGAWLLDTLTRSDPLDFFVLFSSVSSVFGSPGQANHAAANAFLDVLARERTADGRPGLSINWGAWTEVGAAADRGVTNRLSAQGIGAVTPVQGLQALDRLLSEDRAQVAVVPVNWQQYVRRAGQRGVQVFLSEVAAPARLPRAPEERGVGAPALAPDVRRDLAAAPEARRRPLLAAFVRERALRALGVDSARAVDPHTPLGELGLDSLLAIELRNTLGAALGRSLPSTLLFDYPTLDTLTEFLFGEIFGVAADAGETAARPSRTDGAVLVSSIEELSDEEVDRQLAAKKERARRK